MTSDEINNEWSKYKSAWTRGTKLAMSLEAFRGIFVNGSFAREAIQLAAKSPIAMDMLKKASAQLLFMNIDDLDVQRVWLAVQDDEDLEDLLLTYREQLLPTLALS